MGFHAMAQQIEPQDLARQSTGAYLLFIGAWMCWESIVLSRNAWWRDPYNAAKFASAFRKTGRWISFLETHPGTISEMIGDQKRAQGAVAQAISFPACMLSLAGGFMLWQGWPVTNHGDRELMFFANMLRAAMQPIGFLMVLLTPTVTLDKDAYGVAKKNEDRSEIEEAWHGMHMGVHVAGFFLAVGGPLIVESGFLVSDIRWYLSGGVTELPWHAVPRGVWCALLGMRAVATVLQVCTLRTFVSFMSGASTLDEPALLNYKKWNCEYTTLVLSGMIPMYNGVSTLVFAGHGTLTLQDATSAIVIGLFLLETLRCTVGFMGIRASDEGWAGTLALRDFNRIDFEEMMSEKFSGENVPLFLRSLKAGANADLMSLDAAQAGDQEVFALMPHSLGSALPKVQMIVVCPGVVEEVKAVRFDQLSDDDLRYYHGDLARALRILPSASEIVIPFGRLYKWRKMPIAGVLLKDYERDVASVEEDLVPNRLSYWDWRVSWGRHDTAKDITAALRAATPHLGIWQRDMISQMEAGMTLRPLYETLHLELAPLGECTVHFRGLLGAPPTVVAIVRAVDLAEKAQSKEGLACPLWEASREVPAFPPGTTFPDEAPSDADASTPWLCAGG